MRFHSISEIFCVDQIFHQVDVDQCRETAMREGVTAMPTFIIYRNRQKVDQMKVS